MKQNSLLAHDHRLIVALASACVVFAAGCNVNLGKQVEASWTGGGSISAEYANPVTTNCTFTPYPGGCLSFALPLPSADFSVKFGAHTDADNLFVGWDGCDLWDLNDPAAVCTMAGSKKDKKIKAYFRANNVASNFSKLDATGNTLPNDATSWSCVVDKNTGLMWEAKTADGGLHDASWNYSWYQSGMTAAQLGETARTVGVMNGGVCSGSRCDTQDFARAVRAERLCGKSGWRLPTLRELNSLVFSLQSPVVDTTYFADVSSGASYWSTQLRVDSGTASFAAMRHDDGTASFDAAEGAQAMNHAVRLVRP